MLLLVFGLLFSVILQSGCAFKDIDKRVFVAAIGIDPGKNADDKYKITLKIIIPPGSIKDAPGPEFDYLSHEAKTIGEAISAMEAHIDKVLEFSQAKLILINEKLLADEVGTFMDYFTRRGDIQLISYVAVGRPSADKILKTEVVTESPSSIALFNLFDDNGSESPFTITTHLFGFRRDTHGKGIDAILPIIETGNDDKELIVNKSAVIQKKKKPFELSPTQTSEFNALRNEKNDFNYTIQDGDISLLLNINRVNVKYKIVTNEGNKPKIDMKIKMGGIIAESNMNLHMGDLDKYSQLANEAFRDKVVALLKTFQENDVDPLGFGLRYRATRLNQKNTFSDWEGIYPTIDFNVTVDVNLHGTGAIE